MSNNLLKDNPNETIYELESPFLSSYVSQNETLEGPVEVKTASYYDMESPFLTEHVRSDSEEVINPQNEAYNEFYETISDNEFNEAMEYLVMEAKDQFLTGNAYNNEYYSGISERVLRDHFAPLARTAERMFERVSEEAERLDANTLTEMELEAFLDRFAPTNTGLSPAFENFLGKLWNKAKKVAGKAVDLAKKGVALAAKITPLGMIFDKLKGLVKPLLERVLKFALNKLPSGLRPIAQQLAKKLFPQSEMEDIQNEFIPANEYTYEFLQEEFDQAIAEITFSNSESERDFVVNHYVTEIEKEADTSLDTFYKAKADLTKRLSEMRDGEDPTPEIERFVPAVLAGLKIGISIIGRQRVIGFLAEQLAKLIKNFIGERPAKMLSTAVVDTAFKLLSLEMNGEEEANAHWNIVAETLVDTVAEVAKLPEYVFEDQELMEAFVSEAFDRAAATNFPNELVKPEIREEASSKGTWMPLPTPKYKKYTTVFNISFNLNTVKDIKTYDGLNLSQFIKSNYDVKPGQQVNAKVHLYMVMPGTKLPDISRSDKNARGLWPSGWKKMHPLTRKAASILLKESNLGLDVGDKFFRDRNELFVGQRFYYLELDIPSKTSLAPIPGNVPVIGQEPQTNASKVYVNIDLNGEMKLYIYLSERSSQEVAGFLKSKDKLKFAVKSLIRIIKSGIKDLRQHKDKHIKIVRSGKVVHQKFVAGVLGKIGDSVINWIVDKVLQWIWGEIKKWLNSKAKEFITATENPKPGVTIVVTYKDISFPDFNVGLNSILKSAKSILSAGASVIKYLPTEIRVVPGPYHGK